MYADRVTRSMQACLDETARRRATQLAYNAAHGITPRGVRKRIKDLIDGVASDRAQEVAQRAAEVRASVQELQDMDENDLARAIKQLEKQMLEHARNLEFEAAARVRDQLLALKARVLGAQHPDVVAG
jgi:excinuclease ABC subunit B